MQFLTKRHILKLDGLTEHDQQTTKAFLLFEIFFFFDMQVVSIEL